ncbi:tigger transposable element-derived protein 7-like [Portunus trituberculatus]|uniref:tigger transposable element-derived protein 7-like n=1 Tax=Portunus trituberculatus TaxID=210409 RepID=UPI001E1CF52A|nr:tigger transposable element-derived protein 7-like [Portunus trituberculatus]
MHTLPVHYYHSRKAWFNVSIFYDWFFKHFVPEVRRYQKDVLKFHPDNVRALLLLDNAPAHPSADKLVSADGKIRVLYLPANTTSLIQPMDHDVISAVKRRYQRRYLDEVMVVIETEEDKQNNTRGLRTRENIKSYTIKSQFLTLLICGDLKISTLANSWKKLLQNTEPDYDFEGFEAGDFQRVLQRADEKDVTLEDVQEWLDENDADPGYQILSDEEIAVEVTGTHESSSSDDKHEMPVTLPRLSEMSCCMDTVLQFVEFTKTRDLSLHYSNLK